MSETPAADADGPFADTTIRRPRVPTPATTGPPEATDESLGPDDSHDTVIARRSGGRRMTDLLRVSDVPRGGDADEAADGVAAYASRAAAPLRASRKVPAPRVGVEPAVPDASGIRRAIRAQARRRLAAVIAAIICLVVVFVVVLIVLVFAVGV